MKAYQAKDCVVFYCTACNSFHSVDNTWKYNGDSVEPTIDPSVIVRDGDKKCHSFINKGRIYYMRDCTHWLAGITLDLRSFELNEVLKMTDVPATSAVSQD
jgi:hypothetical protein